LTGLEPPTDAVEVEGMIANSYYQQNQTVIIEVVNSAENAHHNESFFYLLLKITGMYSNSSQFLQIMPCNSCISNRTYVREN